MIAACAGIFIQSARRAPTAPFVTLEQFRPVLKVLWPAVALVVLAQWIGLYVAAALYTGFYVRWIGRDRWLAVLAVAILFPVAALFVFEKWCMVAMPKVPLGAWL